MTYKPLSCGHENGIGCRTGGPVNVQIRADTRRGAGAGRDDSYAAWLGEVAARTGRLVAAWQSVGFTHGVLNTDNMSILGDTIDYG